MYQLKHSTADYTYTQGVATSPGIDDAEEWGNVQSKLEVLGFSRDDRHKMFPLFAAVLSLGNVSFKDGPKEICVVTDEAALKTVADLLQVEVATLTSKLTTNSISSDQQEYNTCKSTDNKNKHTPSKSTRGNIVFPQKLRITKVCIIAHVRLPNNSHEPWQA